MAEEPKVSRETINPEGEAEPENQSQEDNPPSVDELNKKVTELSEALKKADVDKVGFIEQIKELRKRAQEAEVQSSVKTEIEPSKAGDDIEVKVKAILSKEREGQAKKNKLEALHQFWNKHSEFNPDNDITGLRMDILNQGLKRLNTQESISTEEILKDYEDALHLMKKEEPKTQTSNLNQFASANSVPSSPKVTEGTTLSPEQEKLRKEKGWTVEKYLKMKNKYPSTIL